MEIRSVVFGIKDGGRLAAEKRYEGIFSCEIDQSSRAGEVSQWL